MKVSIKSFVESYLETAAWVTVDSSENGNFKKSAKKSAKKDCKLFIEKVILEFGNKKATELLCIQGNKVASIAAHDFFLTRNHHGAGFWSSPEVYNGEENAEKLTEISLTMGEVDCYHVKGKKSKLTFS